MRKLSTFITLAGFLAAIQILWQENWADIVTPNLGLLWTDCSIAIALIAIAYSLYRNYQLQNDSITDMSLVLLFTSGLMTILNVIQTVFTNGGRIFEKLEGTVVYINPLSILSISEEEFSNNTYDPSLIVICSVGIIICFAISYLFVKKPNIGFFEPNFLWIYLVLFFYALILLHIFS